MRALILAGVLVLGMLPVASAHAVVPCLGVIGNFCVFHERSGSDCRDGGHGRADDRILLDLAEVRGSWTCSDSRSQRMVFVWASPPVVGFQGAQAGRADSEAGTENYVSVGSWTTLGLHEVTIVWDDDSCRMDRRDFDGLTGQWSQNSDPCPAGIVPPLVFPDADTGYLLP